MLKATPIAKAFTVSGGSATGAAPTGTDGINLLNVRSLVVTLSADLNQLLSGGGSALGYRYSDQLTRWCRAPELDFDVTPTGVTLGSTRDRSYSEFAASSFFGRVAWVPSAVTVDGGANVTVTIEAVTEA